MSVIVKGMEMPVMCSYCDFTYYGQGDDYASCYCSITNKEIDYIARHPDCPLVEVKDEDGWIPCADHLPEEYEVLCCDIRGEIMIGHPFSTSESSTGFSAESEHEYMYDCVAWMQKPKRYRPKEDTQ